MLFTLKTVFPFRARFKISTKVFQFRCNLSFFFVLVCQILSLFHWSETFLEFQCTMITFFFSRREIGILCVCCWLVRSDWVKCLNSFPQKKKHSQAASVCVCVDYQLTIAAIFVLCRQTSFQLLSLVYCMKSRAPVNMCLENRKQKQRASHIVDFIAQTRSTQAKKKASTSLVFGMNLIFTLVCAHRESVDFCFGSFFAEIFSFFVLETRSAHSEVIELRYI